MSADYGVPVPKPAFVVEVSVLFPAQTPAADVERAKLLIAKLHEISTDAYVVMREIRWSA